MWSRLKHLGRALANSHTVAREVDLEVRFHIEMETDKYIREGMTPNAARDRALRIFGPMDKHRADIRDAHAVSWFDDFWQDMKYGARSLTKNKGYAVLAILTLGLGIGANTAIFSVINGVLLKPLPYEHADRLVLVRQWAWPLPNTSTTARRPRCSTDWWSTTR